MDQSLQVIIIKKLSGWIGGGGWGVWLYERANS